MEVRAITRNVRISARKARLVCDAIRGQDLRKATALLQVLPQRSAPVILKTVRSAAANAENNYDLDPNLLYVKRIYADDAPQMKRGTFRARGRFNRIIKRSCHITVIVDEREEVEPRRRPVARRATPARNTESATASETGTEQKETETDGTQS